MNTERQKEERILKTDQLLERRGELNGKEREYSPRCTDGRGDDDDRKEESAVERERAEEIMVAFLIRKKISPKASLKLQSKARHQQGARDNIIVSTAAAKIPFIYDSQLCRVSRHPDYRETDDRVAARRFQGRKAQRVRGPLLQSWSPGPGLARGLADSGSGPQDWANVSGPVDLSQWIWTTVSGLEAGSGTVPESR